MITGFNTDFKYKGVVYHVQTEDNGIANPMIVTLLYQGGAILGSIKTSYADILKFEKLDKVVKELMESQHKQIIKDLIAGKYGPAGEAAKPQQPKPEQQPEKAAEDVLEAEPADDGIFGADILSGKSFDEVILDYLSKEEGK
ncbi:MAG: hypothetical protein HZA22_10040 [Nitrospirae bacterium]|nr:hypothetical protein [Nitrospirota bacterium]MBI5694466.1 hypothetical protein [Nitrospirota bacterium]